MEQKSHKNSLNYTSICFPHNLSFYSNVFEIFCTYLWKLLFCGFEVYFVKFSCKPYYDPDVFSLLYLEKEFPIYRETQKVCAENYNLTFNGPNHSTLKLVLYIFLKQPVFYSYFM